VNDPGLLILTSISSGPKHGQALLHDIDAFAAIRLGPGTLYGPITRLEERGLASATSTSTPRPATTSGGTPGTCSNSTHAT
jgi:DNA-binding PadR family transcriptional regulator